MHSQSSSPPPVPRPAVQAQAHRPYENSGETAASTVPGSVLRGTGRLYRLQPSHSAPGRSPPTEIHQLKDENVKNGMKTFTTGRRLGWTPPARSCPDAAELGIDCDFTAHSHLKNQRRWIRARCVPPQSERPHPTCLETIGLITILNCRHCAPSICSVGLKESRCSTPATR